MKSSGFTRKTALTRTGKIKPKRSKPRPGRLVGAAVGDLRDQCFVRDRGLCQQCGRKTNPYLDPIYAESMHMAHIKAKRMGGDDLSNVQTLCGACHRKEHSYGPSLTKPVPAKERSDVSKEVSLPDMRRKAE